MGIHSGPGIQRSLHFKSHCSGKATKEWCSLKLIAFGSPSKNLPDVIACLISGEGDGCFYFWYIFGKLLVRG